MKSTVLFYLCAIAFLFAGCKKEFLNKKPSSNILTPSTISDLKGLLERSSFFNQTGALPQISADEFQIISDQDFHSLPTATERNAYIWAKDIYNGESIKDWEILYGQIFYTNSVLKIIDEKKISNIKESDLIRGWACFNRAYAYFDLVKNFCKVYNRQTAEADLGIPIRLSAEIDEIKPRATLAQTFDQIFKDLDIAGNLLDPMVPPLNKNRPSKAAVYALKSRILLYQGDYNYAELYADSCLLLHNKLIDYNTVSLTATTPFGLNVDEVIYQSNQTVAYSSLSAYGNQLAIKINPDLINLYQLKDLRRYIFFKTNTLNNYNMKTGYVSAIYPFTGLATDEIYLIKAECLARRNQLNSAMKKLNQLLIKRFETNSFNPLTANTQKDALDQILIERKKELIWRGLRWTDLKRFNRDGANITLNRIVDNQTYSLPPNDLRWVFPIPDQEIISSGIQQNER